MSSLPFACSPKTFHFGGNEVIALVPDAEALNTRHAAGAGSAPYWARLWPASLGLCQYLAARPELVAGKRVLELAAGLGLPGLLVTRGASEVIVSDAEQEAVAVMRASIALNGFVNISSQVIDWAAIPDAIQPEIVLLSDVNYDPLVFDTLFRTLGRFVDAGIPVLLSTPQRLVAKPFIERLLPWCRDQQEVAVGNGFVSVFALMRE